MQKNAYHPKESWRRRVKKVHSYAESRIRAPTLKPQLPLIMMLPSFRFLAAATALALVSTASVLAAPIAVPNGSFESQSGVGQPFGVNVLLDSWEKPANPGYPEGPDAGRPGVPFYWIQTAGAFIGTSPNSANPYTNLQGTQAAYLLSLPGTGIFQDAASTDWSGGTTGLNATFDIGTSYTLTIGFFGKGMVNNFSSLLLSFYYRDAGIPVTIGTPTTVTYNTTTFNPAGPFTLVDYSVSVPTVQSGDAWAGKNIGIRVATGSSDGNGYWDMDNVRLEATPVPEPASAGLLLLGAGLVFTRRRARL